MKFKKFTVLFRVLFMAAFCVLLQNNSVFPQLKIKIDSPEVKELVDECRSSIRKEMEKTNTQGLSIAIVRHGEPLWVESFGSTDNTGKKKVNNKTIFSIESLSKQIAVVAILMAVQDGILDLDVPISKYLPGYKLKSKFDENPQDKITLRHLLSHQAGFDHSLPGDTSKEAKERTLEQHAGKIAEAELIYPVGEQFSYSNIGFDLAGYILQKVSGEPFEQYVARKVFRPLGMNNSFLISNQIHKHENRAIGYQKDVQDLNEVPAFPSCGVYCDIEGMLKFVQFNVNEGKVNGKTILKKDILDQMYKVPFDKSGKNEGYALGIGVAHRKYNGNIIPIYVHSGDGYGFSTDIFYAPEAGLGTVILTNQNNFSMRWRGQLEEMIYKHLGERLEFIK
ncbi:MAG TPA: serine hydrolase domain-containing protein [Ignavibacteriaceae bacterium]|nr:serine hydrolase domain-containing protein [Ignavibacteriaceae bacterium]